MADWAGDDVTPETTTVWDRISDTAPTRRGFDFDGPFACVSHFALGAEPIDTLDADQVRGSLVAISNSASWAAHRCCDPAAGRQTREEI